MSIRFSDEREDVWVLVAPQSWLREYWGPAAEQHDWAYVTLLCGNFCIMRECIEAELLRTELDALYDFLSLSSDIESDLKAAMLARIETMLPPLDAVIASWDGVEYISIG